MNNAIKTIAKSSSAVETWYVYSPGVARDGEFIVNVAAVPTVRALGTVRAHSYVEAFAASRNLDSLENKSGLCARIIAKQNRCW